MSLIYVSVKTFKQKIQSQQISAAAAVNPEIHKSSGEAPQADFKSVLDHNKTPRLLSPHRDSDCSPSSSDVLIPLNASSSDGQYVAIMSVVRGL